MRKTKFIVLFLSVSFFFGCGVDFSQVREVEGEVSYVSLPYRIGDSMVVKIIWKDLQKLYGNFLIDNGFVQVTIGKTRLASVWIAYPAAKVSDALSDISAKKNAKRVKLHYQIINDGEIPVILVKDLRVL